MFLWCMKCMFQIYIPLNFCSLIVLFVLKQTPSFYIQDLFLNMAIWITVHLECQNMLFHEGHLFPGLNAYYNLKYFIFILLYLISSCDMYHVSVYSFWIFVLSVFFSFTVINIKLLTYIKTTPHTTVYPSQTVMHFSNSGGLISLTYAACHNAWV